MIVSPIGVAVGTRSRTRRRTTLEVTQSITHARRSDALFIAIQLT
jgi:hypothetical protein